MILSFSILHYYFFSLSPLFRLIQRFASYTRLASSLASLSEFINLMAMLLMGPQKGSQWQSEIDKNKKKEAEEKVQEEQQKQNMSQEAAVSATTYYSSINETSGERTDWWFTVPFQFKWPISAAPKRSTVEVNDLDKAYVSKFLISHTDAIDLKDCNKRLEKIYSKGASRKDVQELLVKLFSPYPNLHLFTFSEKGVDGLGLEAPLTRKDAACIDQYLRTEWRQPSDVIVLTTPGKFVSPDDGSLSIAPSFVDTARLSLLPAADGLAGNRANPITRRNALDVACAAVAGTQLQDIASLTGCILGVPGFRWPAGRANNDVLVDNRDWSYIINDYFQETSELDTEVGDAVRWAIQGMAITAGINQGNVSSCTVVRKEIEAIFLALATPGAQRSDILSAVSPSLQPAGMPAECRFVWPGKSRLKHELVDLEDNDRSILKKTLSNLSNWNQRFVDHETRLGLEEGTLFNNGKLLSVALKTCLSSQCVTRADVCSVLRALVLCKSEEDVKRAAPPLRFGPFTFRWTTPGSKEDTVDEGMRQEAMKFLNSNAKERDEVGEKHNKAAMDALHDVEACATRGDIEAVLRAWGDGKDPEFIRMSHGTSDFVWQTPSVSHVANILTKEDRAHARNYVQTTFVTAAEKERADSALSSMLKCITREHIEAVIRSLSRSESCSDIQQAACLVDHLPRFAWPTPGLQSDELSDRDRTAAHVYALQMGSVADRAVSGCDYRNSAETILRAAVKVSKRSGNDMAYGSGTSMSETTFEIDLTLPLAMAITHQNELFPSRYPAIIAKIEQGGQADLVGIQEGMHVHSINNQACAYKSIAWIQDLIDTAKADSTLNPKMSMVCAFEEETTTNTANTKNKQKSEQTTGQSNSIDDTVLMELSPGCGGVPNLFWPSFGFPRDPLRENDLRFARGFAAALAEVANLGILQDGFDEGDDTISVASAQEAIRRCASRRQAECVLCALCDDGNEEAVVAAIYMGKWKRSKILPPTEVELKAAESAENRYRNRSLWRKATKSSFNTEALTDTELNLSAAVAIDVASQVLGITYEQSAHARKIVLHAEDDVHRSSVLEACLSPSTLTKKSLRNARTEFDPTRLKNLLTDSPLPPDIVQEAIAKVVPALGNSEDARGQHLIDTFLSVSRTRQEMGADEGGEEGKGDVSIHGTRVDREHRSEYEAIINSVITFDTQRKKSILSAVHEAEKWAQLSEIFLRAIRGDGNKKIVKSARKIINDTLDQQYLEDAKDVVRTSYMNEGTNGKAHSKVQSELNKATNHYQLAHALLDVISNYSDIVSEMNLKRQGKAKLGYAGSPPKSNSKSLTGGKGIPAYTTTKTKSSSGAPVPFVDLRKEAFVTLMKNCSLLRNDCRTATVAAMTNVSNVRQALGVVLAAMSKDLLTPATAIAEDVAKASTVKYQKSFVVRSEREGALKIIHDARHKDPAGTVARAKKEIQYAREKSMLFECVEVVLLSYERNKGSKGGGAKYDPTSTHREQKAKDEAKVHLEHHAQANGGDLLAHINGLGEKANPLLIAKDLPPVMSQREAMAQIKGVDLMRKEKRQIKPSPTKPPGSGAGKEGPKAKQVQMIVTKNGIVAA